MHKTLHLLIAYLKKIVGETNYLKIRRNIVIGVKPAQKLVRKAKRLLIDLLKFTLAWLTRNQDDQKGVAYRVSTDDGRKLDDGSWYSSATTLSSNTGLSIVTLNLEGEKFLEGYLKGLTRLPNIPIEVVFVDHASADNSVKLVEKYSELLPFDFKIVRKTSNDRYSTSNNEGVSSAKYESILFLNNDVIVNDQSQVDVAMQLLQSNTDVGLVGWYLFHDEELTEPQHSGVSFSWDSLDAFFRPKNISSSRPLNDQYRVREYAAVTAAMLLARKSDLLSIDGFDENYNYGYEDVDLCLKYREQLGKKSVLIDGLAAFHAESTSQKRESKLAVRERRHKNIEYLKSKYGLKLNRQIQTGLFDDLNVFSLDKATIGFVVTEAFDEATAGDYFTALELSIYLQREFDCQIRFFPQRGPGAAKQFSCEGVDMLVVLIDRFDLAGLEDRTPKTMVVAWMRNWFDRWQSWPYSGNYDFYLVSSEHARKYLLKNYGLPSKLLRIGTNATRFYTDLHKQRPIDICFIGSKWGVDREIEIVFPVLEQYETHIIGHGWPVSTEKPMFKGGIDYANVPNVYANTKIVIDDAASSTNQWASVNSRVFDALAAGCLVITNGVPGAQELEGLAKHNLSLPHYDSVETLEELLKLYLGNEQLRLDKCKELQQQALQGHSYKNRAKSLLSYAREWTNLALKIAIKVPVPRESVKHEWGDYHFSVSLSNALRQLGHRVRIDLMPDWYSPASELDEVVIDIRGLSEYEPRGNQINLMWNISHPDKVKDDEYERYDVVFVASESYAKVLSERLNTPVKTLLQCTDPSRFYVDNDDSIPAHELIFVGNSRRIYRDVVRQSIEAELPLTVYGGLWNGIVDEKYIAGQNIDNTELRKYYSRARVVLNDHWESMRDLGFISNRMFDVAACGAILVSDKVEGMESIFGDNVVTYDGSLEGFKEAVDKASKLEAKQSDIDRIVDEHSFLERARTILDEIQDLVEKKLILDPPDRSSNY